jgi:hypothetical protein
MLAQTTPAQTGAASGDMKHGTGSSWTGVLVDAKCASSNMPRSTATAAHQEVMGPSPTMRQDTGGRGVARGGTAGDRVSDMNRDRARDVNQGTGADAQLERTRTMEQTGGDADRAKDAMTKPFELTDSANWDRSCFISTATNEFSFHTSDGRFLKFDSSGNSQIKSQLDSSNRVSSKSKIFRAKVDGSVDGETIKLSNIKM